MRQPLPWPPNSTSSAGTGCEHCSCHQPVQALTRDLVSVPDFVPCGGPCGRKTGGGRMLHGCCFGEARPCCWMDTRVNGRARTVLLDVPDLVVVTVPVCVLVGLSGRETGRKGKAEAVTGRRRDEAVSGRGRARRCVVRR